MTMVWRSRSSKDLSRSVLLSGFIKTCISFCAHANMRDRCAYLTRFHIVVNSACVRTGKITCKVSRCSSPFGRFFVRSITWLQLMFQKSDFATRFGNPVKRLVFSSVVSLNSISLLQKFSRPSWLKSTLASGYTIE